MNKFNVKNILLTTTAICAISAVSGEARADYTPTNGDSSAYTVTKVTADDDYDFKWYTGLDEDNNPVFEYYTYEVKSAEDDPLRRTTQLVLTSDRDLVNYNFVGCVSYGPNGPAIYNKKTTNMILGDFIGNHINTSGGASGNIYNYYKIMELTGDFIGNYAVGSNAHGGAFDDSNYTGDVVGNFIANYVNGESASGGAIANAGYTAKIEGSFIGNYSKSTSGTSRGGAIYQSGSVTKIVTLTGNFIDNYAETESGIAEGGAIYNGGGSITLVSDGQDILFKGNYVKDSSGKKYEAINIASLAAPWGTDNGILTFEANNNGSYTFYDFIDTSLTPVSGGSIEGKSPYSTVNFSSNGTGTFNLYNDIKNQGLINFQSGYVLNMISPDDIHKDVPTSKYSYIQAKNITISAAIQMAVDVDLVNLEMDRFVADNFTIAEGGSLYVKEFWIANENEESDIGQPVNVQFVDATTTSGLNLITSVTEAVGDVYAYSVEYNDDGTFTFVKTGLKPKPAPTPSKPGSTAAAKTGGIATGAATTMVGGLGGQTMGHGMNTLFNGINSGDEPLGLTAWVEAFGSNDDVELKHMSSKVDTQFYGLVGGIDSKRFTYDNGLNAVYGIYTAHVNGKQKLDDTKITQKSGYLGLSAALRKEALFSNFSLTAGYVANEANTPWGKDKFDTKVIALATKTGVDVKKDAWTITPSLLLSYTGLDTDDYTAKSGTKVENKFMNVFTVAPELKVAKDFGEGLNGYAKVAYKMFFYDNNKIEADDVLMPSMSVKPYVEYGVGLNKDWSKTEWNAHDLATFAEINRHDGGRTGWDLNLGLKLDF